MIEVCFTATLELLPHGRATYFVVQTSDDESDMLVDLPVPRGGFGSIKVQAHIGGTSWGPSSSRPMAGSYP